jgi:hypothetical protein
MRACGEDTLILTENQERHSELSSFRWSGAVYRYGLVMLLLSLWDARAQQGLALTHLIRRDA